MGREDNLTYSQTGLSNTENKAVKNFETLQKIDLLIKALGTMVVKPQYETDVNNVGVKKFLGPLQQPILQDENREIAENKLVELIKTL